MSVSQLAMPSVKVLSATLTETTEYLARELAHPTAEPPAWSDTQWAVARAASAMQGVTVLLANRIRWSGPESWKRFLAEQREQAWRREEFIQATRRKLDRAVRDVGVPAIALKGSALSELGIYAPGERPMGDIDLLVRPADISSVEVALRKIDYAHAYTMRRHVVFEPNSGGEFYEFGEHVANPLKVEVHLHVAELLPVYEVDITGCLWPEKTVHGLNPYAGQGELMLHLLLHAARGIRAHALRQIQLYDIAILATRLSSSDWSRVLSAERLDEPRWWLYPPLELAERYLPGSIPRNVLTDAESACPRLLRLAVRRQSLTEVSWSNLRIHAFPGLLWSRTVGEALRFMRSRIIPNGEDIAELDCARRNQPQLNRIPWYGISHIERIVRWLFLRPTRVQTMLSLQASFGSQKPLDQVS